MHGRRQDHDRGTAQRPDRSAGMDRDRTGVGTGDSRAEGPSAIRINRQKSKHSADRGGVLAYKRKPGNHMIAGFPLAGDEGFEPPQTESESGVLPLHKSSVSHGTVRIIPDISKMSSIIFLFSIFFFLPLSVFPKGRDLSGPWGIFRCPAPEPR